MTYGYSQDDFEATYSAEDNKLRLYCWKRLDDELFQKVKAAGFKWAPKQELFVAPKWTPAREDLCIELAGEIEPEGTTMAERAEAKAERLEELASKRGRQANAFFRAADELSEAFYMGQPILVGHHSEAKARKTQERMDNNIRKGIKCQNAISYWLSKANASEAHANRKNSDRTRANRIKTLLAELRDLQRPINHAALCLSLWNKITTDEQIKLVSGHRLKTGALVYWDHYCAFERGEMTAQDLRDTSMQNAQAVIVSENRRRWIEHTLHRLAYERSELGAVERFDGELTPVILQGFAREHGAMTPKAEKTETGFKLASPVTLPLHLADADTLEMDADGWRDLMQSAGYAVPVKAPAKPPILNFRSETLQSVNRYHRDSVETFPQIELTKAEFSKIYSDWRGIRLSVCGTFRFKVCADPNHKGPTSYAPRVAVFLTDSKVHPKPDTVQEMRAAA
ncbi:DUF3560 domain-containing protein [Roseibium sp. RKSG952]|uniref:DUF3560 domain-containing protein n=1 Tax=Roseibium sp. RKSG952 TaxID=2529384 RepID=UPI0012BB9DB0|nr:DUF3560 domain-containing protein [Roseibium sp. RKSG952]MTH94945.1 DUF3560 domain-containing protein [Roseibium sp. RKSG952]